MAVRKNREVYANRGFEAVISVNEKQGAVQLNASDVGAVSTHQGVPNAGKFLGINSSGIVTPTIIPDMDWMNILNKPATFPSDWNTLINIPLTFPSDWATLGNKPEIFPIVRPTVVSGNTWTATYPGLSDAPGTIFALIPPVNVAGGTAISLTINGTTSRSLVMDIVSMSDGTIGQSLGNPSVSAFKVHLCMIVSPTMIRVTLPNLYAWDSITDKPSVFPSSPHNHTIAQVTGLQSALDGKWDIAQGSGNANNVLLTDGSGNTITSNLIPVGRIPTSNGPNTIPLQGAQFLDGEDLFWDSSANSGAGGVRSRPPMGGTFLGAHDYYTDLPVSATVGDTATVTIGDITDPAGMYRFNGSTWDFMFSTNIDLTPYQLVANLVNSWTTPSTATYPSTKLVADALSLKLDVNQGIGNAGMYMIVDPSGNLVPYGGLGEGELLYQHSINIKAGTSYKRILATVTSTKGTPYNQSEFASYLFGNGFTTADKGMMSQGLDTGWQVAVTMYSTDGTTIWVEITDGGSVFPTNITSAITSFGDNVVPIGFGGIVQSAVTSVNGKTGVVNLVSSDIGAITMGDLVWSNITGAPASFTPSAHKTTHAIGGTDVLTPADIGAVPITAMTGSRVYVSQSGVQTTIAYSNANLGSSVAYRDGNNVFHTGTPTEDTHVANKIYVDSAVLAGAGAITWNTLSGKPTVFPTDWLNVSGKPELVRTIRPTVTSAGQWSATVADLVSIPNGTSFWMIVPVTYTGTVQLDVNGMKFDIIANEVYGNGGLAPSHAVTDFNAQTAMMVTLRTASSRWEANGLRTNWSSLVGKPSAFTPSAHASTHSSGGADALTLAISQITNLQTALDARVLIAQGTGNNGKFLGVNPSGNVVPLDLPSTSVSWASVTGKPTEFTPSAHAVNATTYGEGLPTQYGHVRLSSLENGTNVSVEGRYALLHYNERSGGYNLNNLRSPGEWSIFNTPTNAPPFTTGVTNAFYVKCVMQGDSTLIHQTVRRGGTNEAWQRYSTSATAWSAWERLPSINSVPTHASTHFTGGTDAITPANIGAIPTSEKNANNGVVSIDANNMVAIGNRQVTVGTFQTLPLFGQNNGWHISSTTNVNAGTPFPDEATTVQAVIQHYNSNVSSIAMQWATSYGTGVIARRMATSSTTWGAWTQQSLYSAIIRRGL